MWWKQPYYKYITAGILLLIFYFFLEKLQLLEPFKTIFQTLFYPMLIAGFLFYVLRPAVDLLERVPFLPRPAAILLLFACIGGIVYTGFKFLAETIKQQVTDLSSLPSKVKDTAEHAGRKIEENDMGMVSMNSITQKVTNYFGGMTEQIGEHLTTVFSTIAGAATVMIIVPFVLFFLLKDGERLVPFLSRAFRPEHKPRGEKLLKDLDYTISSYILGQVTIAAVDGVLTYIGYLLIGLDYALVLGVFLAFTCVIPFVGPVIGSIPAVVVALMQEPQLAIYVIVTIVVVQQLESNLVAPYVFGERLNIHPLTVILLLVVAAPLYGIVGMIIAVPTYSVIKVLIKHGYSFYKMYHPS
ncbi:AI-2E family transporter [Bacillus sp. SB49]|uniref:AI-2E family transporter n=1 Tax=Bacillaceae TaxID=186817 RepID=UPI00041F2E0E|nr:MULTISPECIES: AI-2E family transporter [Bacillaceae]QHT45697.1 AI-2E family transporter [Bacillus sp. SB49]